MREPGAARRELEGRRFSFLAAARFLYLVLTRSGRVSSGGPRPESQGRRVGERRSGPSFFGEAALDRAGLLWGPFSPIYGFGAVLMTLALNRFHNAPIPVVFLVSAVIGGAFEYFVSWFMEYAFGAIAWDYTGTFLNINGRINFMFMCMWGALGVVWVKLALPALLHTVNLIPWRWRYSITALCAALMIFDGAMTLVALDCWYSRLAGAAPDNALEQFCAEQFDNQWMENRFESMSIHPDAAHRSS